MASALKSSVLTFLGAVYSSHQSDSDQMIGIRNTFQAFINTFSLRNTSICSGWVKFLAISP